MYDKEYNGLVYKCSGSPEEEWPALGRERSLHEELAYEIGLGRVRKSLSRRKLLRNDSRPGCEDVRNEAIGTKSRKSVLNRYFFSPMISELFPLHFVVPKPRISWVHLHTFPNYDTRSQMKWSLQLFLAGTVHDSMIPWFYSSSHSSRELIPSASNSSFLFFFPFPLSLILCSRAISTFK